MSIFCKLWLDYLKPFWSRIRWCRKRKIEAYPLQDHITETYTIQTMCSDVYRKFTWTMDDITQLGDSYAPVEYMYNQYVDSATTGKKFQDDCDGFHSVIYHILTQNGYDCVLFTIATKPITKSHTMVIFKKDDCYYLINYTSVQKYTVGTTIQKIVDTYNATHGLKKEHYWNLHKYDYDKNIFYTVKDF